MAKTTGHFDTPYTRPDCLRDNVRVFLPFATTLGYAKQHARRGDWLTCKGPEHVQYARVVGRVRCEGKTYIEAVMLYGAGMSPILRWIAPEDVRECREIPPREVMAFMFGEWEDMPAILDRIAGGFLPEESKRSAAKAVAAESGQ
jgi:hypothetical protein